MERFLRRHGRGAFTLIELLVVIAIIALLVAILLPALGQAKRAGRKGVCSSNLHQFGVGYNSYAADFQDRIASFTWKPGIDNSQYSDLNNSPSIIQASEDQAVDILRRRTGDPTMPKITGWIPHPRYSHLVLNDYLAQRLPEKMVVCPDDAVKVSWQADPVNLDPAPSGVSLPLAPTDPARRLPYACSYQLVPAAFSADEAGTGVDTVFPDVTDTNYWMVPPTAVLGGRKLSEVQFTSGKVCMFDTNGRHDRKNQLYYAYEEVVQPLLFWDASVQDRRTGNANLGSNPSQPANLSACRVRYTPDMNIDPPCKNGAAWQLVTVYYAWTRGGLHGTDYGGKEVP